MVMVLASTAALWRPTKCAERCMPAATATDWARRSPWNCQATRPAESHAILQFFQGLKGSHKLMLISVSFMIPVVVLLCLLLASVNANIRFAQALSVLALLAAVSLVA